MTKLNQEEVESLYASGLGLKAVAKQLGCSPSAVKQRLLRAGVLISGSHVGDRGHSKVDPEEALRLYADIQNTGKVAKLLGCSRSALERVLFRAGGSILSRRARETWNTENDLGLVELYTVQGLGYMRCGQHFGVSEGVVKRACHRLGINDPTRVYVRIHGSSAERTAKRRPFEFTATTKKLRFNEEQGTCQWCHLPIENRFKATYHHIKLIDEGGGKEPSNCMLLHPKCHIDNFEVLHHGRRYRFGLAKNLSQDPELAVLCCRSLTRPPKLECDGGHQGENQD